VVQDVQFLQGLFVMSLLVICIFDIYVMMWAVLLSMACLALLGLAGQPSKCYQEIHV
jgi:uncharacterized membrane protein